MRERFLDGCHKYGWLINLVMSGFMLAYSFGRLGERVDGLKDRVVSMENRLNAISRVQ